MAISTGVSGIDAAGDAFIYQPPNVVPVAKGNTVVNGQYVQIPAGDAWPSGPGVWQLAGGSGASTVTATLTFRTVTITPL